MLKKKFKKGFIRFLIDFLAYVTPGFPQEMLANLVQLFGQL